MKMLFPVGSLKFEIANVNPGTYISGSTWVAWGVGKTPVGVDTGDGNFNTVEKTGGASTHTLTAAEIQHTHLTNGTFASAGTTGNGFVYTGNGQIAANKAPTDTILQGAMSDTPILLLQPYETCYIWKRTA